jgi:hypothetical protein
MCIYVYIHMYIQIQIHTYMNVYEKYILTYVHMLIYKKCMNIDIFMLRYLSVCSYTYTQINMQIHKCMSS